MVGVLSRVQYAAVRYGPIDFEIKGQGDEYIDLSQTYLQVECKFTKRTDRI